MVRECATRLVLPAGGDGDLQLDGGRFPVSGGFLFQEDPRRKALCCNIQTGCCHVLYCEGFKYPLLILFKFWAKRVVHSSVIDLQKWWVIGHCCSVDDDGDHGENFQWQYKLNYKSEVVESVLFGVTARIQSG